MERERIQFGPASAALIVVALSVPALAPASAAAKLDLLKPICGVAKVGSGAAGKVCGLIRSPGRILSAGKKLITGHVGGAVKTLLGGGGGSTATAVGLAAIGAWVLGGAKFALHETTKFLGHTTSPSLRSTWFSAVYWRMASISALLTLPFLFAAAVQALARGDLGLLVRAAFGYLPLALLAVAVAAPLAMLLLAASDELSAIVAAAAGHESTRFLASATATVGVLSVFNASPFLAFLVGALCAAAALVLWLELLMREAAVYVVVLMLPLAFAAMVWPARRIWALRAVELLIALILSKFAIVAVLALGGAALGHKGGGGLTAALAGTVLVLLGAFTPWALLRLMPLGEIASAAGSLRGQVHLPARTVTEGASALTQASEWASGVSSAMRRQADEAGTALPDPDEAARAQTARLAELGGLPGGELAAASAGGLDPDAAVEGSVTGAPPAGAGTLAEGGAGAAGVGAAGAAGVGAAGVGAAGGPAGPRERMPGRGEMWQAPDMSWRPLTFGLEHWPPPPDWWKQDPEAETGASESHGPLPPRQGSEEGPL